MKTKYGEMGSVAWHDRIYCMEGYIAGQQGSTGRWLYGRDEKIGRKISTAKIGFPTECRH